MDRIDALRVFVTVLDEGSLAGAGRKLGRSPAAVSRAVAFLEAQVGTQLLYRTTRSIRTSEAGERYAAASRRILTDLEEADIVASAERSAPRGLLSVTASVPAGEMVLRPIIDAFLDAYPMVSARLLLLNRIVNLVDEGIDVALRIGHHPDSTMMAISIAEARQVIVAAPHYLERHPPPETPSDLVKHHIITLSRDLDTWSFPALPATTVPRSVQFAPRLVVNSVAAAVASAVDGCGVTRMFSYIVADHVREGRLEILLTDHEYPPFPVHLIAPNGRLAVPKVHAFFDFAVPRLRDHFARLTEVARDQRRLHRARSGRESVK